MRHPGPTSRTLDTESSAVVKTSEKVLTSFDVTLITNDGVDGAVSRMPSVFVGDKYIGSLEDGPGKTVE